MLSSASNIVLSLPNAKQLETGDFDLDELIKRLTEAFADESQRNEILQLTRGSGVLIIECLDKIICSDTFRASSDARTSARVFSMISKLSRRCQYLPHSYWVDPRTITLPNEPHASGSRAITYRGAQNGESVAVKVLKTSNQESMTEFKKRFCKEVILQKHMSCPYILKLNGVFYHNDTPAIVIPWMPRGNIAEYLEKHADADRLGLLLGAVKGIKYLHDGNVVHGGIKASNILISDSTPPRAMLADFGFTRVATALVGSNECTASFMAPELLLPAKFGLNKEIPSKEADIYAFGMTVYQVLVGKRPFFPRVETEIVLAVISGERPLKPKNAEGTEMTEVMWDLLRECWREDRAARPNISDILRRFHDITGEGKMESMIIQSPNPSYVGGKPVVTVPGSGQFLDRERIPGNSDHSLDEEHNAVYGSSRSVKHHCFPPWNHVKRIIRSMRW